MLKPILIFVGLIAAGIAAMALLWVAYAIIAIYVYAPLKHRWDVAAAERLNDETYRSGNGYAFEVAFTIEVGGEERTEARTIACVPKRVTHLELVSGPMTWDVMEQISDDFMRVPVDDFHAVVFGASSFNCEKMVRSYRDGDGHVDVGLSFRPWLAPDDDTTACFVLMEEDRRSVGALVIHRPKVASVSEVPVRELLSRERYGPPDYMSPGPTWPKARVGFAWLPDAGCWEARGPVNPPGMGVYRKPGAQVCDATANRICGFP